MFRKYFQLGLALILIYLNGFVLFPLAYQLSTGLNLGQGAMGDFFLLLTLIYAGLSIFLVFSLSLLGRAGIFRFRKQNWKENLLWTLGIGGVLALLSLVLAGSEANDSMALLLGSTRSNEGEIIALIYLVLVAPLFEELLYRGFLLTVFKDRLARWGMLVVAGLLFGVVHTGFVLGLPLLYFSLVGLLLGFLFQKTESIYPSLLLHFLHNVSLALPFILTLVMRLVGG